MSGGLELADVAGELSFFDLLGPLLDPRFGANILVDPFEVVARLVVVALDLLASVEVYEILPAIARLVLVGKPGVELRRHAGDVLQLALVVDVVIFSRHFLLFSRVSRERLSLFLRKIQINDK